MTFKIEQPIKKKEPHTKTGRRSSVNFFSNNTLNVSLYELTEKKPDIIMNRGIWNE